MLPSTFDRETILDLTVNMIPLGILMFFIVAFGLFNPFGWNNVISSLQFGILIAAFVLLTILTYYAGKAVSEAEAEMEGDEDHTA
ncbi:hypothetical protein BV210_02955 [Halorientalis sp. IM1011]|uniref:DUF6684 family protein n=1 Tax=Halorientalis sp. IM1011 TaxID=1932360 RepID=UPI00097CD201|nr:DUF6684 family protein [Halorientalis sp. IM1011]AQL41739.1 hypothetical protein BV210_02955 [Halorientalis sp. IM1011]